MKKHIWLKTSTYLILIGVCVGILFLEFIGITILSRMNKGESINDNIAEGIAFLICFPGIFSEKRFNLSQRLSKHQASTSHEDFFNETYCLLVVFSIL